MRVLQRPSQEHDIIYLLLASTALACGHGNPQRGSQNAKCDQLRQPCILTCAADGLLHGAIWKVISKNSLEKGRNFQKYLVGDWMNNLSPSTHFS